MHKSADLLTDLGIFGGYGVVSGRASDIKHMSNQNCRSPKSLKHLRSERLKEHRDMYVNKHCQTQSVKRYESTVYMYI